MKPLPGSTPRVRRSKISLTERGKGLALKVRGMYKHGVAKYKKASLKGKLIMWLVLIINITLISAIIIITPHRIGLFFERLATRLRTLGKGGSGGMAILFLCVVLASHPPLFGFAGSLTLIGFTFGLWPGMLLASVATMTGAAVAFLSIRTFFLNWMRQFGSERSERWEAFSHVVKTNGTLLVVMIRWCPVPWAVGNGLFASIDSVSFPSFMLANLVVQPRLLVPVFIGSRLHSLAGDEEGEADPVRKWVNVGSIIIGLGVSFATGFFIYRATLRKMRELGDVPEEEEEDAVSVLERNALLGDYSGDSNDDEDEDGERRPTRRNGHDRQDSESV